MSRSNAEPRAVADTSVAVAAILDTHTAHSVCRMAVVEHRAAIAGHALMESYSVLTRLPAPVRLTPTTALRLLHHDFPTRVWLDCREAERLLAVLASAGIAAGAVYDAMVGAAALAAGLPLLTRDQRALSTYRRLGIDTLVVGER